MEGIKTMWCLRSSRNTSMCCVRLDTEVKENEELVGLSEIIWELWKGSNIKSLTQMHLYPGITLIQFSIPLSLPHPCKYFILHHCNSLLTPSCYLVFLPVSKLWPDRSLLKKNLIVILLVYSHEYPESSDPALCFSKSHIIPSLYLYPPSMQNCLILNVLYSVFCYCPLY